MSKPVSRPQFHLWQLMAVMTGICLWLGVGYYAGIIWIPFSLILTGPILYCLGQWWGIYLLELLGVLMTLTIPVWMTLLVYRFGV